MNNVENSMCWDISTEQFDIEQEPLINIDYRKPDEKYQSSMIIGNITINNIRKFNWLQKKMFKFLLGIEIKDLYRSDISE